jgi:DNA-binding SARP family transcriptional activator/tetratricopeptide (TPR) repeat protein
MSSMLELRLLGPFEARTDGVPVALPSVRAQSLLACLALGRGEPQRRERVAYLLWPDSADQQARTNLRHVLHTLRATIGDRYLHATAQTLALREFTSDVTAFDAADGTDDRAAVDRYTGDLMEGCYDEWLTAERDEYRRRVTAALSRLVPRLEQRGELDAALRYAERARTLDRLAEAPYRALMRLHDAHGDRARAVRVYHECVTMLEDELGVPPSDETRALYETLLPPGDTAPRTGGVTAYVGRQVQRRQLTELWRVAWDAPQLVVVTGEPGIGKTRLVEEFRLWVARQGAQTATARSYAAEGALAYAPVAAWLRDLGVARWRGRLTTAQLAALAPLVPELSVEPAPPEPGSRLRLFDAATRALTGGAAPVLLIADDVHAADSPTLQFLHYLVRADPDGPLLVAATARPAETDTGHPLPGLLTGLRALGRCTEVPLDRMDRRETATLARRLGHRLDAPAADRLHAATEGNPLFVVEALRAGWRGGEPNVLTPRVQAVLETRLRQLTGGARDLVGLAAAAGSSVSVDVLTRVGTRDVAGDLDELWRRQVLLTSGGDTYDFSHDKLREVAYRMLSPAQRRHHHAVLGRALREVYTERLDAMAGQIAAHLQQAGDPAAVDWYVRAAAAAQRVYADADAADLLDQAWRIARSSPRRELEVLTALPGPLAAAEGYASPRLRTALDRAFVLADRLHVRPAAPLLRAQAMAVLSRGEFDTAVRYGAQLCALDPADDVLAVEGHFVQGVAAAWRNATDAAAEHLQAAIDRYRPANRSAHLLAYSQDPQVLCLIRLAHVRFCQGATAEARRLRDRALTAAHHAGHPFTLATALVFAALLELDLGDLPSMRNRVESLIELRDRVEAPPIRLSTDALTGYLEVLDGAPAAGLARIGAALADPARATAPGLTAMLCRIRLAAARAAGDDAAAREAARRLLADDVRVWDTPAAGAG